MDEREISRNSADLIYLVACALHNTAPEEAVVAEMDFDALYRLAQEHSLTAMACMGLENGNAFRHCGAELFRKWKEAKEKAVRKNLLLESEWQKLQLELEKSGIWYAPLKGSILKNLYTKLGMRQMGDYDILFDADKAEEVKLIFENQGYHSACAFGKGVHDIYEKPPVMEFEMHRALFDSANFPEWAERYKNVKSRLIAEPGKKYGFRFSDEDFYVYITAHAYKHFSSGGTGLRTLVDFYVYNWKKAAACNWEYVQSELEDMSIAEYESNSRRLADKLFGTPNANIVRQLSADEKNLLCYYLGSGTYGRFSTKVENAVMRLRNNSNAPLIQAKMKYIFPRLFPDKKWYQSYHPFLYDHPWLIPFFTIYRITIKPFGAKRKKLLQELRVIFRFDQ